ncbi:MAG: FAD binding domain-containing protein [Deltaproteobacteria bacterium]|nr:FAD binding domain-containing protein [Deltaproteobacteria bacterium]
MWQAYKFPDTIKDAVSVLNSGQGMARIIAGGTDLMLDIQRGRHAVETLVDLANIKELGRITEENGEIKIGANVTCTQIVNSKLIQEKAPALCQGARKLGSKQIRNIATIAGNIVRAQPAADTAVPLVALGAKLELASADGTRTIDILDAYGDGFAKSTIDSTSEILTFITFPTRKAGEGSSYVRLDKRKALSLPILNIACKVVLTGETIKAASIAMGPVGPGPQRAFDAENRLSGSTISEENTRAAAQLVINQCDPRDSLVRGSRSYRLAVIGALARRAITEAVACAKA